MEAEVVVGAADLHHLETELLPREAALLLAKPAGSAATPGPAPCCSAWASGASSRSCATTTSSSPRTGTTISGASTAARNLRRKPACTSACPAPPIPSVAPAGHENLFILVPAPALPAWGAGGPDGTGSDQVEAVADAALDQLAAWAGIEDLRERIVVRQSFGPGDFVDNVNAWQGGALGLAHTLGQSAFFRPSNHSSKVRRPALCRQLGAPGHRHSDVPDQCRNHCQGGQRDQGQGPDSTRTPQLPTRGPNGRTRRRRRPMTYLSSCLALIACMGLLDARYRLFVFAQPVPALLALPGATAMFLLWDVIAIDQGIFLHRESPLMTGVMLGRPAATGGSLLPVLPLLPNDGPVHRRTGLARPTAAACARPRHDATSIPDSWRTQHEFRPAFPLLPARFAAALRGWPCALRRIRLRDVLPALGLAMLVLLVLTAVFDNLMIASGLFGYGSQTLLGIRVGLAPWRTSAIPLCAVLFVPALWWLAGGRTRAGHRVQDPRPASAVKETLVDDPRTVHDLPARFLGQHRLPLCRRLPAGSRGGSTGSGWWARSSSSSPTTWPCTGSTTSSTTNRTC